MIRRGVASSRCWRGQADAVETVTLASTSRRSLLRVLGQEDRSGRPRPELVALPVQAELLEPRGMELASGTSAHGAAAPLLDLGLERLPERRREGAARRLHGGLPGTRHAAPQRLPQALDPPLGPRTWGNPIRCVKSNPRPLDVVAGPRVTHQLFTSAGRTGDNDDEARPVLGRASSGLLRRESIHG